MLFFFLLFLFIIVGVEGLSTRNPNAETLRETSDSFLSPEHQSEDVSLRISTSLLEFDSSEVYSDKEGKTKRTL